MAFHPRLPHLSAKALAGADIAEDHKLSAALNELASWLAFVSQSTQSAQFSRITWLMFRIGLSLET